MAAKVLQVFKAPEESQVPLDPLGEPEAKDNLVLMECPEKKEQGCVIIEEFEEFLLKFLKKLITTNL